MKIGSALGLIAVGLILAYAVDFELPGVDVGALGAILFYIGVLGLVVAVGLEIAANRARRPPAPRRRRREEPAWPPDPDRAPVAKPYDPIVPQPSGRRRRDPSEEPTRSWRDAGDDATRRLP